MEFQHTYCAYLRSSLDDRNVLRIIECLLLKLNLVLSNRDNSQYFSKLTLRTKFLIVSTLSSLVSMFTNHAAIH